MDGAGRKVTLKALFLGEFYNRHASTSTDPSGLAVICQVSALPDIVMQSSAFWRSAQRKSSASNWKQQRPTGVQNRALYGVFSATRPRKGNRVIETYGAGDGNRTHV
jgi:hypothetical protein